MVNQYYEKKYTFIIEKLGLAVRKNCKNVCTFHNVSNQYTGKVVCTCLIDGSVKFDYLTFVVYSQKRCEDIYQDFSRNVSL